MSWILNLFLAVLLVYLCVSSLTGEEYGEGALWKFWKWSPWFPARLMGYSVFLAVMVQLFFVFVCIFDIRLR